jgi:hypothetical protein
MKTTRFFLLFFSVLLVACGGVVAAPTQGTPTETSSAPDFSGKKVVWVDSYHSGYEWSDGIQAGIENVLQASGVELKIIHMDTKRNPDVSFCEAAGKSAKAEIEAFQPDVLIATDDNAQKCLVVPFYKGGSLPVVFAGVKWRADAYGYPAANITGMVTIQAVIARAFFARSNLVLNRKNHALGDCFTRKKRSFAVTPLFRVDG